MKLKRKMKTSKIELGIHRPTLILVTTAKMIPL